MAGRRGSRSVRSDPKGSVSPPGRRSRRGRGARARVGGRRPRSGSGPAGSARAGSSARLPNRSTAAPPSRSSVVQVTPWSSMLPAAARIVANGVRRSWDTESSRAVMRASLRRATSASSASETSRSRCTAWPSWSAAADRILVSARSGSRPPRDLSAQSEPRTSPGTSRRTRWTTADAPPLRRSGPTATWVRTHRAGSAPGIRWSTTCHFGMGRGSLGAVSATTRSSDGVGPSPSQDRSIALDSASWARTAWAASVRFWLVASERLILKRASASRARSVTACACVAWRAASRPIATATARNRSRFSHSFGSLTVSV